MSELARVEPLPQDGSADHTVVLSVTGEIDLSNAEQVRDAIGAALPVEAAVLVVDLSGTQYLDSAGIAMLFRLAERLGWSRQELHLVVPPDAPIRAAIRITHLDTVITVHDALA
ncbi:anti-sigma factor antagonist [Nocardioides guangzhouensis]|uniref:Anti-sigma factor antagonist n=1 Tax=Nocardioides guangzhouensis TaxID=2497878 RepID=A0A4Q4ZJD4_9ACTN|nr:STAS domain-containing protein [Nocardioides guangzhouensis]RYP88025.1 anti-sigma factor antagonist [Nocardioides guangzhouensis]